MRFRRHLMVLGCLAWPVLVQAAPVHYYLTFPAAGIYTSTGGKSVPFAGNVSIAVAGDTNNVVDESELEFDYIISSPTVITIPGLGPLQLTPQTYIFSGGTSPSGATVIFEPYPAGPNAATFHIDYGIAEFDAWIRLTRNVGIQSGVTVTTGTLPVKSGMLQFQGSVVTGQFVVRLQ